MHHNVNENNKYYYKMNSEDVEEYKLRKGCGVGSRSLERTHLTCEKNYLTHKIHKFAVFGFLRELIWSNMVYLVG